MADSLLRCLLVVGRSGTDKQGAAPVAHIDWSIKGLRAAVRSYRTDLRYMALDAIRAEAKGETPRYAAFSIWVSLAKCRPAAKMPANLL